VVGLTKLDKTQSMIGLGRAALKVMSYEFLNVFSANKIGLLCFLDLLSQVCYTVLLKLIQATDSRMLARPGVKLIKHIA